MEVYKLIAVLLAYGLLWDALTRCRVRAPERRLQLQVYGCFALFYALLVVFTGGASPKIVDSPVSPAVWALCAPLIHGYFGAFSSAFLILGTLEVAVGYGFRDPSLPLLSRWWVRAMFEGPVWRLLSQRRVGAPLLPDESESCYRHAIAGLVTVAGALWAAQISLGWVEWISFDPVALLIFLRALNVWLDARIWNRVGGPTLSPIVPFVYPVRGEACTRTEAASRRSGGR